MMTLHFNYNWNQKLNCLMYTTIRVSQAKYAVGNRFEIQLNKKTLHVAEVVAVKEFKIDQINAFIAGLDTGYSIEEAKAVLRRMYKNADLLTFVLVLLKRVN